jgi:hypothetical protein
MGQSRDVAVEPLQTLEVSKFPFLAEIPAQVSTHLGPRELIKGQIGVPPEVV